jgi:SAM-dependent methyltransferase
MREAGERLLARYPSFRSVEGTSEATGLPPASVDWIVAGQAFHWFDVPRARAEFLRILRPGGSAALVWNVRREDTPFLAEYERMLHRFAIDYAQVKHQNTESDGRIDELYRDSPFARRVFPNHQEFDVAGLEGRTLSSSYLPAPDQPGHNEMLDELRDLFDRHASAGVVRIEYETRLYVGTLQ